MSIEKPSNSRARSEPVTIVEIPPAFIHEPSVWRSVEGIEALYGREIPSPTESTTSTTSTESDLIPMPVANSQRAFIGDPYRRKDSRGGKTRRKHKSLRHSKKVTSRRRTKNKKRALRKSQNQKRR